MTEKIGIGRRQFMSIVTAAVGALHPPKLYSIWDIPHEIVEGIEDEKWHF